MVVQKLRWSIVLSVSLGAVACADRAGSDCPAGQEGCACFEGECLGDLACLSNLCVEPGDPSTGELGNESACENWIAAQDCGRSDLEQLVDCDAYDALPCDLASFFECLTEHTSCVDGALDVGEWSRCSLPPECGSTPGSTSTGDEPEGTDSSTTADDSTSSGGTNPGACEPAARDDACDWCVKDSCCDQLVACVQNPTCECLVECVAEMGVGELTTCQRRCGSVNALPPEALPLQSCQQTSCPVCG